MKIDSDEQQLSSDDEIALHGALLLGCEKQKRDYLRAVCSGDEERLARLSDLLGAEAKAERLFTTIDSISPPPAKPASQRLGKFALIEPIGSGGMGTVFLAEDTQLQRLVALKVPRPDFVGSQEHQQRFLR